jgi:hypothetical protein
MPPVASLQRLEHEYSLCDELDSDWAVSPLAVSRHHGKTMLLLEDPGGEPLDSLREVLDPNGQLIVDLIPELEFVIGKQSPVPELGPWQNWCIRRLGAIRSL